MLVSSLISCNHSITCLISFLQKTVQISDQFFLYMDPESGKNLIARADQHENMIFLLAVFVLHMSHTYTVKKGYRFSVPSRDVTIQTFPGRE
jgi:hypothetical protein